MIECPDQNRSLNPQQKSGAHIVSDQIVTSPKRNSQTLVISSSHSLWISVQQSHNQTATKEFGSGDNFNTYLCALI